MFDKIGISKRYNIFKDKPTNSFHRRKLFFNDFDPEKCIEEQPTFTFENDRNINYYKSYIENQTKAINKYSENYINYMNSINPNNKIATPYNLNENNIRVHNRSESNIQISKSQPTIFNKDQYIMKGRSNEISNPVKYYQNQANDYNKFHNEEMRYLDYNQNIMNHKKYNEINVNPFNKGSSKGGLGQSSLRRNPILNPLHDYSYNKYFDRESFNVNNTQSERTRNSLVQAGNSIFGN
jgi:hypothetical protein